PVDPAEEGRAAGGALACGRPEAEAAVCLNVRRAADLPSVLEPVAAAMTRLGYPSRDVFAVRLGLEEALVNAIKHGNRGDPGKRVRVRYRVTAEEVRAEVEDQGQGFDPDAVDDPLDEAEPARPSGRGLLLMRHYLDGVGELDRVSERVALGVAGGDAQRRPERGPDGELGLDQEADRDRLGDGVQQRLGAVADLAGGVGRGLPDDGG